MRILEKINISENLLEEIKKHFSSKFIKYRTHLFYQGQIPITGFFLLKGNVKIYKNKKNKKTISEGSFFGVHECLNKSAVSVSAEALPETEIFLLDQSTLKEILEDNNNNLLKNNLTKILSVNRERNE